MRDQDTNNLMNIMKMPCAPVSLLYIKRLMLASAITAALSVNGLGATNLLTNPGFESGNLTGWTTYGNSIGNASVQSGASVAHSGTYYFKSYGQFIGATNYSGIIRTIFRLRATPTRRTAGPIPLPAMVVAFTGRTRSGLK